MHNLESPFSVSPMYYVKRLPGTCANVSTESILSQPLRQAFDILPTAQAGGFPPSRVGVPVSTRLASPGFHPPRSYSLSAGFKYRESHGMYVPSSVHISVMMDTTCRAHPMANIESKRVENMSTLETTLTGRIELVDLDKVAPVPV